MRARLASPRTRSGESESIPWPGAEHDSQRSSFLSRSQRLRSISVTPRSLALTPGARPGRARDRPTVSRCWLRRHSRNARDSGDERSTINFDAGVRRIFEEGSRDGVFSAGFDDNGVFRTYEVWQSNEHRQRFVKEILEPLLADGPVDTTRTDPPNREYGYEASLHGGVTRSRDGPRNVVASRHAARSRCRREQRGT
jgi:hypothetical protein